ncbi:MAG: GYD domain-containing protein [Gammaproteobacteria bacterium]|nr:GYD domain-containing protein [Gammaproteobacteria bacterium]
MSTFFMFGNYTPAAVEKISAARTTKAQKLVEKNGGKLKDAYALLGEDDLVLIVELPDLESAVKVSLALHRETGVSFRTCPALEVAKFDELAKA